MKKRRVLALFLALSMALSSNGFTALAAENDSVVAIEADLSEGTDETDGENIESDTNDEIENNASESEDGSQDNTGENGNASEGGNDISEGENASDGNGATDGGDSSGDNGEAESDNAALEETGDSEDDVLLENSGDEGDVDVSDKEDVLDDAESEKDVQVVDDMPENAENDEIRMYTFTDETGMSVTYNRNEKLNYNYTVKDHVLTSVKKVNEDGTEETLTGVVELEQKASDMSDAQYYTTIAASVFNNNKKITYVMIPQGVTTIGDDAFKDCTELKGISLPVSLTSIGNNAFRGCTKLIQLSIPKAVTSIGSSAFEDDSSLFMVFIKDYEYSSMTSIGEAAFKNCRKLEIFGSDTDFVLPGYLETIGKFAFEECRSIKKVTLPDSLKDQKKSDGSLLVRGLGEGAFRNCIGMTDLVLSGVETISIEAFSGCSNLLSVKFANGNKVIEESAFANCSVLSEIKFSTSVSKIGKKAFYGCTKLLYVDIPYAAVEIDAEAFPTNHDIWLRGFREKGNGLDEYLNKHNNIKFIAYSDTTKALFKYEYHCLTDVKADKVKFTGADLQTVISDKGVEAGTRIYVGITTSTNVKLKAGSLRCNGTPIGKDKNGEYTFTMPVGGAYVTAEYERTGKDESKNILGNAEDVDFGLSNGTEIKSEEDTYSKTYELKVGQSTKMFLIDTSSSAENSVIDPSKITFTSKDSTIATVSDDGTIKAVKKGTTVITAMVSDRNSITTSRQVLIRVSGAEIASLRLKPVSYDNSIIDVDKDSNIGEVTGISLRKADVESKETTFILIATAYDKDKDNMSVALKWSSSDSKVAKPAKSSTKDAESQNVITIPKGASGNATITVTATNKDPIEAEKQVVSKFVVSVRDNTPRLSSSSLTINPYQNSGAALEIIGAYDNKDISDARVYLRSASNNNIQSDDFRIYKEESVGSSTYIKCNVSSVTDNMKDGAYNVSVHIEVAGNEYDLPLTINVKKFKPNPKVTFAKNQAKINLFYANDGTQVVPVVSNLGSAKIAGYRLENLSNSADDLHFAGNSSIDGNFQIDEKTGVITRYSDDMYYTSKNKPVVTGKLVLTFQDYKEGFNEEEYKITIPTQTTKPSYKLNRTSDTFSLIAGKQEGVILELLDNKKNMVDLSDGSWNVEMEWTGKPSPVDSSSVDITYDGKITMDVNPNYGGGKVVLNVTNDTWDKKQVLKYNYTVKISNKKPTFKLSKSTLSMSKCFAGNQTETVTVIPNQYGVEVGDPHFEPQNYEKLNQDKKAQYALIDTEWMSDSNEVSVSLLDSNIKKGTYKLVGYPYGDDGNKVVLTVKVTETLPTLSIKGSAALNRSAGSADTATLTLNVKNCPSNCTIDADSTSTIECVTNQKSEVGLENEFDWIIEDNNLKISLQEDAEVYDKTYTFKMIPKYSIGDSEKLKPVKFKVKVYQKNISVSLKAKGKINLLERYDESIEDNTTDTPVVSNMAMSTANSDVMLIDTKTLVSYSVEDNSTETTESASTDDDPETIDPGKSDNGKTVTYVKNGNHTVIKKTVDGEAINNSYTDTTTDDNYTFVVVKETGYETDVKVYKTSEYGDGTNLDSLTPISTTTTTESDGIIKYTIANADITEPITIVVTDIYTITITNKVDSLVSAVTCKVGDAAGYTSYNPSDKPKATYGESLSFSFTQTAGAYVVVMNGDTKMSANDNSPVDNPVYSISNIENNVNITILTAYEIAEDIPYYNNNPTAQIEYDSLVNTDALGTHTIIQEKDLSFTVKPRKGYDISKVEYKLSTASEDDAWTELTTTETTVDGKKYKLVAASVTANVTIKVTTQETDANNWTIEFSVEGAKVKVGTAAASSTPAPILIDKTTLEDITFNVSADDGYKIRYVGTDELGKADKLTPLDDNGTYKYTLPASPEPVTTIYVKATPIVKNIKVTFTGLIENSLTKATVHMVTFDTDNTRITTTEIGSDGVAAGNYEEDSKAYFMVTPAAGYMKPSVNVNGIKLSAESKKVKVNDEITVRTVYIYTLDLAGVYDNVTVEVMVPSISQGGEESPSYKYTLTNSIEYTPIVSNLKDTVIDAKIFDSTGAALNAENSSESDYFNIDVRKGLLYVTPKTDLSEDVYLRNNTTYPVKIWLKFEKYQPEENAGGIWVDKIINIKTAQILPKVTTDTDTINLYQSNPGYTATFVVRLKEGSVGKFKEEDTAIAFGDKDEKAKSSLECETEVQEDGSLRVTISLKNGALYATNSTNKVKMYIQYENQAQDTLTSGTAITMNVKING